MRVLRIRIAVAAALGAAFLPFSAAHAANQVGGMLADPVMLNIGLSCRWEKRCMSAQQSAMKKSLKYVSKYRPPEWRVHLCNKNAKKSRSRIDWGGFDHCVRNEALRPPPPPAQPHKKLRRARALKR